jgi:hypothetical protein
MSNTDIALVLVVGVAGWFFAVVALVGWRIALNGWRKALDHSNEVLEHSRRVLDRMVYDARVREDGAE